MTNCLLLSIQEHWKYSAEHYTLLKGLSGCRACVTWLHIGRRYVKCLWNVFSTQLKLSKSFFSASEPIRPSPIMPQLMRALGTKGKILRYCSFGWAQRWQASIKSHHNSTVCSRLFLVHWPTIHATPLKSTAHILTLNWLFSPTRGTTNALHIKIYGLRNLWAVTAESLCRNVPLISKWCLLCFIKMLCSLHKQCEESV